MSDVVVKIKTETDIPNYETSGSAGMDVRAHVESPVTIKPGKWALVPTGLYIELPVGYEAQIRARSGLSVKKGITLINGIGTIDSDYRGEIKIGLLNLGEEEFVVSNGDRIAQMVVMKYERAELVITQELSDTDRGDGGFGHTGVE